MIETKNSKAARDSPDRGDIRTLQALDQAAGGSGDIAPENGTDDARCEDSSECDVQRQQMAEKIHFRISHPRTVSRPGEAGREGMAADHSEGDQAPKQERTDAEIRAEIEGWLKADQLLDEANIFVSVSRGRVIIEGSVENHEAKQRAEAISRQARGIIGHDSNLAVRKSP